jgi:cytidine deaminase
MAQRLSTSRVDWKALAREAELARTRAYAPYSHYHVGAALLASEPEKVASTQVFHGANMENASYGLCVCAERNAIAKAVHSGARRLVALAVATPGPSPAAPCGMCRQVLAEFVPDLPIALVIRGQIVKRTSLAKLLPLMFGGEYLDRIAAKLNESTKRKSKRR